MQATIRSIMHMLALVLGVFSFYPRVALGQEDPKLKVQKISEEIMLLPNLPKLDPFRIQIDRTEKKWGPAYYFRYPRKKFPWLKGGGIPTIHISKKEALNASEDSLRITLAHELGHHFEPSGGAVIYLEPQDPMKKIIEQHDENEKSQYFADAFALYLLGEEVFRNGRLNRALRYSEEKGVYWIYIKSNPRLHQYYIDQHELWVNYWLDGAKSRLADVIELIKKQQTKDWINNRRRMRRFLF